MATDLPGPCGIDGCEEEVVLRRLGDGRYRVRHGAVEAEDVRLYSAPELLVTTGYRPWVRELHKRDATPD